jgi:hypothetical protein
MPGPIIRSAQDDRGLDTSQVSYFAPAGGVETAAGHRLFDRSTSGYHPSGSITTLFTFFGPGISAT